MSKKNYKFFFLLFLCLNILLLGKIYFWADNSKTENSIRTNSKITHSIDNLDILKSLSKAFHMQEDSIGIKLFLFFPQEYCGMCIDFELPFLKLVYSEYPEHIVIGNKSSSYNLNTIISEKSIEETNIENVEVEHKLLENIVNPTIILAMWDGTILLTRESSFEGVEARKNFYSKVGMILK